MDINSKINDLISINNSFKKYLYRDISLPELIQNIDVLAQSFDSNEYREVFDTLRNISNEVETILYMNEDDQHYNLISKFYSSKKKDIDLLIERGTCRSLKME